MLSARTYRYGTFCPNPSSSYQVHSCCPTTGYGAFRFVFATAIQQGFTLLVSGRSDHDMAGQRLRQQLQLRIFPAVFRLQCIELLCVLLAVALALPPHSCPCRHFPNVPGFRLSVQELPVIDGEQGRAPMLGERENLLMGPFSAERH